MLIHVPQLFYYFLTCLIYCICSLFSSCRIFTELYTMPLTLPLLLIVLCMATYQPHTFIAWICFSLPALLKCSQVHTSISCCFACLQRSSLLHLAQVSVRRDKLLLAADVVIACRGRTTEMSADAGLCLLERLYLWAYVNPSALFLPLVKYNAILNSDGEKNEKWPAAIASCLCRNILCHFEKGV